MRTLSLPFLVSSFLVLSTPLLAQRGGGGRSEAILERVGCYFVDAKVEAGTEAVAGNPFSGIRQLQEAAAAKQPALLFLFDPKTDAQKFKSYEQTMFGREDMGIALRPFRCVRLDITTQSEFMAKYGAKAPIWFGFDQNGKLAGEVSQPGSRAAINPVTEMLERAATGYVKGGSLETFIEKYRDVVRDLAAIEGKRKGLALRRQQGNDKDAARNLEMEKDDKAIDEEEKKVLAREKDLLEQAHVQPRDAGAKRIGGRDRDRGR